MPILKAQGSHLAEIYRSAAEIFGDLPAFATRRSVREWHPVSFRELYEAGVALATSLMEMGVARGDHVGLLADNRFEWILADYGVQLCGAADVPRGRDVTDAEIVHILRHAGTRVVFVENETLQRRVLARRDQLPELQTLIRLDVEEPPEEGVLSIHQLVAEGRRLRANGDRRVEERAPELRSDDLFTLIYTSGTTGVPKGVMLTHANMISQLDRVPLEIVCTDRVVSILPVWHIFERVFEMLAISRGACTYYSGIRTLAEDLENVEPTFMGSAPRLWESLHHRILKRAREAHPVRRALFHIAYFLAHHYKESVFYLTRRRIRLKPPSVVRDTAGVLFHAVRWLVLLAPYGFFNAAVLERLRLVVGGAFKGSVSGGGALPREVDQFFNYLGIPVLEGYGLTETAPVVAVRTPRKLVIGTVGPLLPDTEVRIVDVDTGKILFPDPEAPGEGRGRQGEIQVRGPQVMKGYYRDAETTEKSLGGGWFRTGDLGVMTYNDCLRIVGRCKDTIVLSSGENVEPRPIEERLGQSPLIEHCMIVGQDRKFLTALVTVTAEATAGEKGSAGSEEVRERVRREIRTLISTQNGFKQHERIHDFRILPGSFAVGEELTNLQKLRRHVVVEKNRDLIESMYSQGDYTRRRKAKR